MGRFAAIQYDAVLSTHGKPLAYTVAVLCAAVAGACFLAGYFLFFDAPPDQSDDPRS